MKGIETTKLSKATLRSQIAGFKGDRESGSGSSPSTSSTPNPIVASSYFVPRTTPGAQPSISSLIKKREKEEADKLLDSHFLWSDIPFSVAKNNPFYQAVIDAITVVGVGYKAPSYDDFRRHILQNEKVEIGRAHV